MQMIAVCFAVVIVVLIIVCFMYCRMPAETSAANTAAAPASAAVPAASPAHEGMINFGPEIGAQNENIEYFSSGLDATQQATGCNSTSDSPGYDTYEYGAPGMDFKDYIAARSLDPQIVKNHQEFVKDRIATGDNKLGTAFDPGYRMGELEGSDEVPWQGLRRPQHVPVANPTQLPEFNPNSYTYGPKFTWSST